MNSGLFDQSGFRFQLKSWKDYSLNEMSKYSG